jgi:hypothetical protein
MRPRSSTPSMHSPQPNACNNTPFDISCAQPLTRTGVEGFGGMIPTPNSAGLGYLNSPGLSTLPSLSPSMGSPVQGLPRSYGRETPQTPPMSFDESTLADPPLFGQSGPGQYSTNGWLENAWEEDPFASGYDIMP